MPASRAGADRRPKPSAARSSAGRVSRRAGAIRAIEPVTEMIAATRSAIVGWVANAPSCAPSIIMASCPAARPGMTLRPSMRRSAETSAAGFWVSRTASASAMNSRAEAISSRVRWLPSTASRRRNIMTRTSTTITGSRKARIGRRAGRVDPLQALRAGPRLQQLQRVEADIGGRDQANVSVHDVDDLVRCDGCQLVVVQSVDQTAREDENGVLLPDAAGECVERRTVDDADIRGRQACRDCQRLDDTAQPRLVVDRRRSGNPSCGGRCGRARPSAPRTAMAPMTVTIGTQRTRYPVHP